MSSFVIFRNVNESMPTRRIALTSFFTALCLTGGTYAADGLRAHLEPVAFHVPVGQPVLVSFMIQNKTSEPITLQVPEAEPAIPDPEVGLPLTHVFSSPDAGGVELTTQSGRRWEKPVGYRAPQEAPILLLAPHSSVGTTLDLREFFPALRTAGEYRIAWQPYAGRTASNSVRINIAPQKRVKLTTDDGMLTIDLFYQKAPKSVANFVELVESGFYTGQAFHRLEPGYLIQGGCARGDGTGVRPDGSRVPFEPNDLQHDKGTVSMALRGDDPDSASSQFFIAYSRQKSWDGRYTIFGRLIGEESYETLDSLMSVEVDEQGRPRRSLYIRSARTVPAPTQQAPDFP